MNVLSIWSKLVLLRELRNEFNEGRKQLDRKFKAKELEKIVAKGFLKRGR